MRCRRAATVFALLLLRIYGLRAAWSVAQRNRRAARLSRATALSSGAVAPRRLHVAMLVRFDGPCLARAVALRRLRAAEPSSFGDFALRCWCARRPLLGEGCRATLFCKQSGGLLRFDGPCLARAVEPPCVVIKVVGFSARRPSRAVGCRATLFRKQSGAAMCWSFISYCFCSDGFLATPWQANTLPGARVIPRDISARGLTSID
jgi:hypothetical protein